MSDVNVVATESVPLPADAPAAMSVSDAARMLSEARRAKQEAPPAESAPEATADEPELAVEANAESPQPETAAEDQGDEPELPAIDPPRSWSKEARERWSTLDRSTQEFLASRDSEDQKAIKRSFNEAAETRKALEAQMAQAEQIRKEYEAKLPALTQTLEMALQNEFGDITSLADVRKMQAEDPFRYQQWDLRQKELAAAKQQETEAAQRQQSEKQANWVKFIQMESKAFADEVPEFKAKEAEYTKKAASVLSDLGFTNEELNKLANGEDKIALYDRRLQRLLFDRIKLDEIKAAPAKAIPKPVPPVQRPGVAKGGNPSVALQIQNLETQLAKASGKQALLLAAELTRVKRSAAR